LEVSVECDSTCGAPEHSHLHLFVIHNAKWQTHTQVEVLRGICIQNLKVNTHSALPQDEMIASTHWALGTFVQLSSRPPRQLARIREQVPYTLHWYQDDLGWTYFHRYLLSSKPTVNGQ
jgi:hypothetical protein